LNEADQFDACLLTSLDSAQEYYDQLIATVSNEKIYVSSILGMKNPSPSMVEGAGGGERYKNRHCEPRQGRGNPR